MFYWPQSIVTTVDPMNFKKQVNESAWDLRIVLILKISGLILSDIKKVDESAANFIERFNKTAEKLCFGQIVVIEVRTPSHFLTCTNFLWLSSFFISKKIALADLILNTIFFFIRTTKYHFLMDEIQTILYGRKTYI